MGSSISCSIMTHLLIELMDLYATDGRPLDGPALLPKWMEVNTALLPAAWFLCVFITCKRHRSPACASGDTSPNAIITFNIANGTSRQTPRPGDSISSSFRRLCQQIIKDHYLPSARWAAISHLFAFHLSALFYSSLPPPRHVHVSANKSFQFVPSPTTRALIFIYDSRKKRLSDKPFLAVVIRAYCTVYILENSVACDKRMECEQFAGGKCQNAVRTEWTCYRDAFTSIEYCPNCICVVIDRCV